MPENNRKMQTDISELENGQLAEQQLPSDFTLVVLAGGASSHMGHFWRYRSEKDVSWEQNRS